MCGGCKGEIQDAPAVPADHCDVGQHGAGAGWLDGQQLAHHRFDASLLHGHVWKDSTPTPAPARTLASGQGDVPGDKRSGPWRSWDHYGAQPDLRPANQPLEDKWQTVMADVRPGTKPRQPSKKSHTSAADEPKLLDSLTVADGSCNASTVPLVNYSFKVNVTKLFFDGERADARGADLIWALYNLLSFTVRVLVPLVYGLMKECGSGFLYTLLVRTHLDIIMPMPFVLSTFVGGAIVGLQKVRNLFLQTGPDRRRGCSMGDMARSMVMAIFMETVWWLALPCIFLCWPLFKLLRLLIVIDRILYAFGMLMYGLCMVCYGGVRYILIGCFNQTLSWVCWPTRPSSAGTRQLLSSRTCTTRATWACSTSGAARCASRSTLAVPAHQDQREHPQGRLGVQISPARYHI